MQSVCGLTCALDQSRAKQAAKARKSARKAAIAYRRENKTKAQWTKEAQTAINAYVRERDRGKPCISCGRFEQDRFKGGHFDCGHYRSTGAASHLRFHLHNMAGQCKYCNRDLSGNVVEFRKGLIKRIGEEAVIRLEYNNDCRTSTKDYLARIKAIFKKKKKRLIEYRENVQL